MAFMKKDVNAALLMLVIVSIVLFTGFSVYYQTTFKDVSLEYKNKLEQLGKVTSELGAQKQKLNETFTLRQKAEEDKKVLDERYQDVSTENDRLDGENTQLKAEVSSTKSELAEKTAKLDATQNLLSQTQSTLSSVRSERDALKAKKQSLDDDLEEVCAYLASQSLSHNECD